MKKLSTGVRSSIDIGRLSKAVSRPGVDPRVWITLAVVLEVAYDEKEGVFADVQTIPDGDYLTCYVGSPYAGDGFGTLYPPKVEEIVLVAVPQGDYNIGPVIFSRLHTGQAPPPSEFQNPDGTEATSAVEEPVTGWSRAGQ